MEVRGRRYSGLDILKALCVMGVVHIHAPFPGIIGAWCTVLARIAVPVFFIISGFCYCSVVAQKRQHLQIKRILILLATGSMLSLAWGGVQATLKGVSISEYLSTTVTPMGLCKLLLLNVSPFDIHLWYLNAFLYVLIIIGVMWERRNKLYWMIPVLLLINLALGKYSIVFFHINPSSMLSRNFLFIGLPCFCMGAFMRDRMNDNEEVLLQRITEKKRTIILLVLVLAFAAVMEDSILSYFDCNGFGDIYVSTIPMSVCVFLLYLCVTPKNKLGWIIAKNGSRYSTQIYIIHIIVRDVFILIATYTGLYRLCLYMITIITYTVSECIAKILVDIFAKISSCHEKK